MKYLKVMHKDPEDGSYIEKFEYAQRMIEAEFDSAEPGDRIVLELVEMSEDEFEHLDEFEGW